MGRRSNPSLTLAAVVRTWYGLTQVELGLAIGVSRALVEKAERGARRLPRAAEARLELLARLGPGFAEVGPPPPLELVPLLAPATETPPPAPPGLLTPAERQEVARRLARLEREAYRLRVVMAEQQPRRTLLAARWAAALPALQAAAAEVPPPDPATAPPAPERWLAALAAERAAPPAAHTPGSRLTTARDALRLHLLTREICFLQDWLAD